MAGFLTHPARFCVAENDQASTSFFVSITKVKFKHLLLSFEEMSKFTELSNSIVVEY